MKKYCIIVLGILIVICLSLSGCNCNLSLGGSQDTESQQELQEFQQRLEDSLQAKNAELSQINIELADIRDEINDLESRLSTPLPMAGVHNLSAEELAESLKRTGLRARLAELKEKEQELLNSKQSLEEDIEELKQLLGE